MITATSNGSATATVETLTAEVRVLQVGNRQVTLSVAKQLDYVGLSELTVFGRAKLGGSTPDDLVIGSDANGVLALARYGGYRKGYNWRAWLEVDSTLEPPVIGWDVGTGSGEDRDCFEVTITTEPGAAIPCLINRTDCTVPADALQEYQRRRNEWFVIRNAWWKEHQGLEGFAVEEPERPNGRFWDPGPHRKYFAEDAKEQLAKADSNHKLY